MTPSFYAFEVGILATRTGRRLWTRWRRLTRSRHFGKTAMDFVREEVRGKSFVDVGCMWNVNGEYCVGHREVARRRERWAINAPDDADVGYANWFWGITPSCITAMAETAGFRVEAVQAVHPFAHVFLCRTVDKEPVELRSSAYRTGPAVSPGRRSRTVTRWCRVCSK